MNEVPGMSLFTARVISALPYRNLYQVETTATKERISAIALEAGGDRRGGIGGGASYMPGTAVILAASVSTGRNAAINETLPPVIMGAITQYPKSNTTDHMPKEDLQDLESSINNNMLESLLIHTDSETSNNQDNSFNKAMDTPPGEYSLRGQLGSAFILSDFLATLRADKDCGITFTNIDKMAEMVSRNLDIDVEVYRKLVLQRSAQPLSIEEYALDVLEAHGGSLGLPALISDATPADPNRLKYPEENMKGYFRHRKFNSGVEGQMLSITAPDPAIQYHKYGEGTYPGILIENQRMDGIYRLQAAKEIRLEKRPYILVPQETKDLSTDETGTDTPDDSEVILDVDAKVTAFGLESDEEMHALTPLMEGAFGSFEEEKYFYKGLKRDGDLWVFPTKEDVKEAVQVPAADISIPTLDNDKTEYDNSDISNLLGEELEIYPGRKVRLFNNSSVFLMAEDGGVTLGDGHGAELRMSRGNITLSSIADVKIMPGRDLITYVPGNTLMKTEERFEITSSNGSLVTKAEENVHILSGNGGEGSTVLENRANDKPARTNTIEDLNKGKSIASGIWLKATDSHIHMASRTGFFMGPHEKKDSEGTKLGLPSKSLACPILIDSGSGPVTISGDMASMLGTQGASVSTRDSIDGFYCVPGVSVVTSSGLITYSAPIQSIAKETGSVKKPYLDANKGVAYRNSALPKTNQFIVDAEMRIKGDILQYGSHTMTGTGFAVGGHNKNNSGPGPLVGLSPFKGAVGAAAAAAGAVAAAAPVCLT